MRTVALGLLLLAAVIFVLTHGHGGVWGYVNAAAEAAMVGAVADWFAVTALFRHPMGVPIPHTAIIPERKDAIGASLEDFVAENFLTPDTVQERLAAAQIPARVGRWLAVRDNSVRVVRTAAPPLARGLESIDDREVLELLDRLVLPRLSREPIAPVAGHLLEGILRDRSHTSLVDLGVRELHDWVAANPETIVAILGSRAPWWSPRWLDDTVTSRIHLEILRFLADVRDDPEHQTRQALDHLLGQLAHDLQHDEATMAQAESLKEHLLKHPSVPSTVLALWASVRTAIVDGLRDEDSDLHARLSRALTDAGERLGTDEALRDSIERRLESIVGHVVTTYGRELTSVITTTIERWDGKEAASRIELHVGRDLQFIRINGTIVGGLVGLLIYTIAQLL
ncbi:DUF445 domain-containing protein [Allobranchiibius sp. GilTou38]|uniref:DUF445 domain-containing protein n=1 Tax=Allobranchiibius sp. GilTou38 TaxID=2815210 RepID=UPI001AA0BDE8|nr:DUF445 domain-containing protein [Allobranchiibius sp. GilTou38]MBO1766976.1 DUF445 domain-containing protein [Allobranchiibius sp. GilTou38]